MFKRVTFRFDKDRLDNDSNDQAVIVAAMVGSSHVEYLMACWILGGFMYNLDDEIYLSRFDGANLAKSLPDEIFAELISQLLARIKGENLEEKKGEMVELLITPEGARRIYNN